MTLLKYLLLFALLTITAGVYAMTVTDIGKVYLFSAISGTITADGKAAANVRLVRTAALGKTKTDETQTDENGYFEFPAIYERSITKFLPQEFVAKQDITAHYNGQEIKVWDGIKRKPEENVESRGKPLLVECELLTEEKLIIVNNGPIHSRCIWNVEPDASRRGLWDDRGVSDID